MTYAASSPEATGEWVCPKCPNRTEFKGIDFDTYGGPAVCHCGAQERNDDVPINQYKAECICVTTLVQPLTIRRDAAGAVVEVEHHVYSGGAHDSEIGEYDKIICGSCGEIIWLDPQYKKTYATLDHTP